ncbi:MAG: hypothetical protein RL297_149 [Pseudomonadota bacterium]|jgi:hypothetical protein
MQLYCVEDRQAPFIDAFVQSSTNYGFSPKVIAPNSSENLAYARFRQVYRHLSINPEAFELACFRRYFEVATMVQEGERFIIADSDLLLNAGPADLPTIFMDQTNVLVGSIGRSSGTLESDISPHFSFWTPTLLRQFVDYLIHAYESQDSRLEHIYRKRQDAGNKRAAISDMTLLHLFMQDESIAFIDSNQVVEGLLIDHNFCMTECANATFKMNFGFKAFHRERQILRFTTTTDESVRPVAIHLQGRAKIASQPLLQGNDLSARMRLGSLSAARIARAWLV